MSGEMSGVDVLKEWAAYISLAEDHIITTGSEEDHESGAALADCIEALAAEVRVMEPLAEIGRALLAIPDATELYIDWPELYEPASWHDSPEVQRLRELCAKYRGAQKEK